MVVDIFNTGNRYQTIYADPPWWETGGGRIKRGADRHYSLMKTSEIIALPIREIADPEGCHCYLWATNNHLKDAFEVLEAWGFEYVTLITWQKDKAGLGQYYRGMTEHCLFGTTKQRLPYKIIDGKRQQGVTGFQEPRREHSRKPETMREMIETVSYAPRIELFAREERTGWDAWGLEVQGGELLIIFLLAKIERSVITMKMDYESAWNELKNDLIDLAEAETATASCEAYRRVYMKMGKIEQEHHRNSDGNGKGNVSGDIKEDVSRIVREALKDSGVVNNLEELEKKIYAKPTDETRKPKVIFVDGDLEIPDDLRREALRRGIRIVGVSAEVHRFPIPPFLFGELPF